MVVFPNAKINIGLNVLRKREDGFHDIETMFYPIPLKDILEVVEDTELAGDTFQQTGLPVEAVPEKNLCVKALKLMRGRYRFPTTRMHLHKVIPLGAGLGGGSSDASFALKLVNELFNLNLNTDQLQGFASQLGSDCPFFIDNVPVIAGGRGEVLKKIGLSLKGYFLVLVHPKVNMSTSGAYALVKPKVPEVSLERFVHEPVEKWKEIIKNDFELPVFQLYPRIKEIKSELYQSGAVYAAMTGSGSAVYGIFRENIDLQEKFKDYFVYQEWLE